MKIKTASTKIRNAAHFAIAAKAYRPQPYVNAAKQVRYDRKIAKSQAKIGPYVPASIPVQVWA